MAARLNILVVEDNDELRGTTLQVLGDEGHHVTGVSCAEDVPEHLDAIDLMLIDLNLPGEDGLALATRIRRVQPDIGLVMVTARHLPADRTRGYTSGADIYLTKPVSFAELCAAVGALARRVQPRATAEGGIRLHARRLVLIAANGVEIPVSSDEAALLIALLRTAGQRMESWQLIELLQKDGLLGPKAALELQLVRLRKKLRQAGASEPILQNIRGWGYQLCSPIQLV